jgi:hypothetical protein
MISRVALVLLLSWYPTFFQKNTFINYLSEKGYRCIKMESYKEIIEYLDTDKDLDDQIIYLETDDVVYGFTFFKKSATPELFISDNKSLTYFLSSFSMVRRDNLYKMTLNNLYSAHYISFENATISYIMFNYGMHYVKTIINTHKIEGNNCKKSSLRCETIPYPQFSDTTCIRANYKKFYGVVGPKMKNLSYEDSECPKSEIMKIFNEFLLYRNKP